MNADPDPQHWINVFNLNFEIGNVGYGTVIIQLN
jgi:hypothetical protein